MFARLCGHGNSTVTLLILTILERKSCYYYPFCGWRNLPAHPRPCGVVSTPIWDWLRSCRPRDLTCAPLVQCLLRWRTVLPSQTHWDYCWPINREPGTIPSQSGGTMRSVCPWVVFPPIAHLTSSHPTPWEKSEASELARPVHVFALPVINSNADAAHGWQVLNEWVTSTLHVSGSSTQALLTALPPATLTTASEACPHHHFTVEDREARGTK